MIDLLEEQNDLLKQLIRVKPDKEYRTYDEPVKPVLRSSVKMDQAIQWLRDHPEAREQSGRELEGNGLGISYKTWNEAKKRI